jgi:valyl-tRNA synthetase
MQPYFSQMAHATASAWGPATTAPDLAASRTLAGQRGTVEVFVDVSRFIDVVAERKRLEKDRENIHKQIKSIDGKLSNKGFVDKAPAEVVQQQRDKLTELREQLASVEGAMTKLGA